MIGPIDVQGATLLHETLTKLAFSCTSKPGITNLLDQSGKEREETGVDLSGRAVASLAQQLPQTWQHRLRHIYMLSPVLQEP